MDVKITITCDENALEFSRNLQGFYMNLVSGEVPKRIGKTAWVSENEEKLKAMENEKGERPWEQTDTVEPDEIKMESPEPLPTVDPKPVPSAEVVRAAAAEYMNKKGKVAFKALLTKYGVEKLTQLEEKDYLAFMEDIEHA